MPHPDFDRLSYVIHHRWHIIPEGGKWLVMQDFEPAGCQVTLSQKDDLRESIDDAWENGDENLAKLLERVRGEKTWFAAEYTMNPGEQPAVTDDPCVAFLQQVAASHDGLTDEARSLIHQAAEAQRKAAKNHPQS